MKKRVLGVLLCAAMLASMAAGCGRNDGGSQAVGTGDLKGAEDVGDAGGNAAGEGETLTIWCWDSKFNFYAMEEAGKMYQAAHPEFNASVVEMPWDSIQEELEEAAGGALDALPDVMLVPDYAFQKNAAFFPEIFADITDSGIDFSRFDETKTAYSAIGGKNYGVPFNNGTVVACYRTDILKEAGFTLDDFTGITWDEYLEKGKAVLEKTGKPLLSCLPKEPDIIMMMLQSCGVSLFDEDGRPAIAGNEALKEAIGIYQQLVETGVCKPVNSWNEYVQSFATEEVAGVINGCWIMASIQSAEDQSGKWGLTNMPRLAGIEGAANYADNGGASWTITGNCKNMDLAIDFLKSTFAGSIELYETIFPGSGAFPAYLPARDSSVYEESFEFYGGDAVCKKIIEYAGKCPDSCQGIHYYEGRDAIAAAIEGAAGKADVDAELEAAQDALERMIEQ